MGGSPLKKPSTGRLYCAAKWCNNRKCDGICMFRFPKDKRKELWVAYANRPEFLMLPDSKIQQRRLCSEHFDKSAFMNSPATSLKRNAVPSVPVTNKRLQFLVPPAFFQDPSLPAPKKDLIIDNDTSAGREIIKLKDTIRSPKLQREPLREDVVVEEQLVEDQSSFSFVPSPLELALVPEQFGKGDASVDTFCSDGIADLELSIGLELAGLTRTVAQQTENRDSRASSFTTFVCLLSKEGAATQVSHEQSGNVINQNYNSFLEEPIQSHISYLIF